jgi:hypothetical protein
MFFERIHNHPHTNQHGLQCLQQSDGFVGCVGKIDSRLTAHDMKLIMVLTAERQKEPTDMILPPEVVLLNALRAAAETSLRALGTLSTRARWFHTAPPETER